MERPRPLTRRSFTRASSASLVLAGLSTTLPTTTNAQTTSSKSLNPNNYEIWDLHGHLAGTAGRTPAERIERIISYADRLNVRRTCIYMGMAFSYDPSPEEMVKQNNEVMEALKAGGDRVLGFVYLNPKHLEASLKELERCVADGPMVGIKLWVAAHANIPQVDTIVQRATELQAVVFQHTWIKVTGNLPGESTPMQLAELASRHPSAKLICGHAGGDWEQGIRAIRAQKHVTIDLGGGEPVAGFTEMAIRELGFERVLYGSDVPGRGYGTQLAKVFGAAIPEEARRGILSGNLKRLLTPILQAKGMRL